MNQSRQDLFDGELLQMRARLAQHDAARFHFADPEFFADQMIQRHAAGDHIAAAVAQTDNRRRVRA